MISVNTLQDVYADIMTDYLQEQPLSCLSSSKIDRNPHQIEAFIFALMALNNGGAILADEVGLGKTIEAALVMQYYLSIGKKRILLIVPSGLSKQWQMELEDKFSFHAIIADSQNIEEYYKEMGKKQSVVIASYHFASSRKDILAETVWDLCVIDEAHRLRNVYKPGAKMSRAIYELTSGIPKLMLTATPIQNNLMDIYGLAQFIDERIFYSKSAFRSRYIQHEQYSELRYQLSLIVQRTLRSEVAEYLRYPKRREITVDFELSLPEIELYMRVDEYLKRPILFALPNSRRGLITSVIRKLLASSSVAVAETFKVLKERLVKLRESSMVETSEESLDYFFKFIDEDDLEEDDDDSCQEELYTRDKVNEYIQEEIDQIDVIIKSAENIKRNSKLDALKQALKIAVDNQDQMDIPHKAIIFTESVRTQQYLYDELTKAGYKDQILVYNGSSGNPVTKEVYKAWKAKHRGEEVGSRSVEVKNAIVEAFRDWYQILIATDSGSEGLNLQFCNTVINYDLPWNPQKIEQRIGRCHRYGQKNDVVVINLLNTQNYADKRVYEILSKKFELFEGVFGASDKAIGLLENGFNFEKRVTQIYQDCSSAKDFTKEFSSLEKEIDRKKNIKAEKLKELLSSKSTEDHKAEFARIAQQISDYDRDAEYWSQRKSGSHPDLPIVWNLKENTIGLPGKHGVVLLGVFCKENHIVFPFMDVQTTPGKFSFLKNDQTRHLLEQAEDGCFSEGNRDDTQLRPFLDAQEKKLFTAYEDRNATILLTNRRKLDNWLLMRKEDLAADIADDSEISALQEQCDQEKNFTKKIELKKQIEQLQHDREKKKATFLESTSTLEKQADEMQEEFQQGLMNHIVMVVKACVRY